MDLVEPGQIGRRDPHEQARAKVREHEPERAADGAEQQALHGELADDAPAVAPSAARSAISRVRTVARASSRFATFAHAMRNRTPTAPSSKVERAPHVADHPLLQRHDHHPFLPFVSG
jgi:hypothetical protein